MLLVASRNCSFRQVFLISGFGIEGFLNPWIPAGLQYFAKNMGLQSLVASKVNLWEVATSSYSAPTIVYNTLSLVHTSNNVESTFDFVAQNGNNVERVLRWNFVLSTKSNVASTLLLVWTDAERRAIGLRRSWDLYSKWLAKNRTSIISVYGSSWLNSPISRQPFSWDWHFPPPEVAMVPNSRDNFAVLTSLGLYISFRSVPTVPQSVAFQKELL